MIIRVNVSITNISAERFCDVKKSIPPIQINTNINAVGLRRKSQNILEVPFALTIIYNRSIAQISLKGTAYIKGDSEEIEKIFREHKDKKPPPQLVMQSTSNIAFIESVIISKTLNLPPPIPLPQILKTEPMGSKPSGRDYSA